MINVGRRSTDLNILNAKIVFLNINFVEIMSGICTLFGTPKNVVGSKVYIVLFNINICKCA